ncbi:putative L-ascorbate peroxidase [Helianthus debilis subsp. tardiflorus]
MNLQHQEESIDVEILNSIAVTNTNISLLLLELAIRLLCVRPLFRFQMLVGRMLEALRMLSVRFKSVVAVEIVGGPEVPFHPGRETMGLDDIDIVTLSCGHTLVGVDSHYIHLNLLDHNFNVYFLYRELPCKTLSPIIQLLYKF